jgi:hypothetical protein
LIEQIDILLYISLSDLVMCKEHPRVSKDGYIREHILIFEKYDKWPYEGCCMLLDWNGIVSLFNKQYRETHHEELLAYGRQYRGEHCEELNLKQKLKYRQQKLLKRLSCLLLSD